MATIAELLGQARGLLDGSDSPRLDSEVLLGHVLGCDRSYFIAWPERAVDPDEEARFMALIKRRQAGEPIAYLTGEREFWSLPLKVSPATLIPRPDTELLVEIALEQVKKTDARVLDLGAGTGAIALALASERSGWSVTGVDVQAEAVALARENAQRLSLSQVVFSQSDWFEQVSGHFDLIVSNPPYIAIDDAHLGLGDVRFEPASALVAEGKGLADIQKIITQAKKFLAKGGLLLIEHGASQGQDVRNIFEGEGYQSVETRRDLAGLERATLGRLG